MTERLSISSLHSHPTQGTTRMTGTMIFEESSPVQLRVSVSLLRFYLGDIYSNHLWPVFRSTRISRIYARASVIWLYVYWRLSTMSRRNVLLRRLEGASDG